MFLTRLVHVCLLGCAVTTTSSAALTAAEAQAFVRDYYAAYHPAGVPRMMEFYTADATFNDPTFGLDLKSRQEIGDLLTIGLAKYESLELQPEHTILAGDDLVVEGTMVGRLMGKTVRVRFASVFHFTDGKISAQRDMFDTLHFYVQLGIVPPQFRPKPAEPKARS